MRENIEIMTTVIKEKIGADIIANPRHSNNALFCHIYTTLKHSPI